MSLQDIEREFKNLSPADYKKTSDEDEGYNCIAWAVEDGKKDAWWSPFQINGYYWPANVERGVSVGDFVKLYETICGYEVCADGAFEKGYEKIALYADSDNEFCHVARQKSPTAWTSKLGIYDDIEHTCPFVLEADYGKIKKFMRRRIKNAKAHTT